MSEDQGLLSVLGERASRPAAANTLFQLDRDEDTWTLKFGKSQDKVRYFALTTEQVRPLLERAVRVIPNNRGQYIVHFAQVTLTLDQEQYNRLWNYLTDHLKGI